MKKGLIASYMHGILDMSAGEKYSRIIRYFAPEYVTTFVISALPIFIDSAFIGHLKSTPTYAALGIASSVAHFIFKIAEAFSIGAVIHVGYFNSLADYKEAGRVLRDTFWTTIIVGLLVAAGVYAGAYWILAGLGTPNDIIVLGIPYLRLRALSFVFIFIALSFLGFLRGIKNTRTIMYIYVLGAAVFIFFDYCLVFGAFGFPALGLNGSAYATIIQNAVMLIAAMGFIFLDPRYKAYGISLFSSINDKSYLKSLFTTIWPVAIDKAALAVAYIWLNKMINPMGTFTAAAFCAVKDLERIAFLPALAFAQVITFLVSNDYALHRWENIKSNIKKVLFLSTIFVGIILVLFSLFTRNILSLFDKCGNFTDLTAAIFPWLSILVLFDILQLILSGALRGAGNVRVVMWTRVIIITCFFMPISYVISGSSIANPVVKFLCIYSSFYLGNAIMSFVYINRFRSEKWKHQLNNDGDIHGNHNKR